MRAGRLTVWRQGYLPKDYDVPNMAEGIVWAPQRARAPEVGERLGLYMVFESTSLKYIEDDDNKATCVEDHIWSTPRESFLCGALFC